jgi:hypothetical protein
LIDGLTFIDRKSLLAQRRSRRPPLGVPRLELHRF